MVRIHLLVWPCRSMQSGQRAEFSMMMPFAHEKSSFGRPLMFHSRVLTGSPSALLKLNASELGIAAALHDATHSRSASALHARPVSYPRARTRAAHTQQPVSRTGKMT